LSLFLDKEKIENLLENFFGLIFGGD